MKNGIYYNGQFLEMSYEELVDLFASYRDKTTTKDLMNNVLTLEKVENAFGTLLPKTDY